LSLPTRVWRRQQRGGGEKKIPPHSADPISPALRQYRATERQGYWLKGKVKASLTESAGREGVLHYGNYMERRTTL